MTRQLGPHRSGDPAFETLRSATARLLDEVGDVIHPAALELRLDDALAPELMSGERVDTLMLTSHEFGLDGSTISSAPESLGSPGVVAFTERRMIGAHATGYVRMRRFVEAFALDGEAMFRAVMPDVDGDSVRLFEVGNGQGWHRIFLPGSVRGRGGEAQLPDGVIDGWSSHMTRRLAGGVRPRWDGLALVGWNDTSDHAERADDDTVPVPRRLPPPPSDSVVEVVEGAEVDESIEPSGPLPRPDLSDGREWWN